MKRQVCFFSLYYKKEISGGKGKNSRAGPAEKGRRSAARRAFPAPRKLTGISLFHIIYVYRYPQETGSIFTMKSIKKEYISMAEMQQTYVTQEFLEKMKKELEYLKSTKRLEVAQRLKEAIALGDLSENSEYVDAKNEQAFTEGKILELEAKIRTAVVIEAGKSDHVTMASSVRIKDLQTGDEDDVTIVGSSEADPFEGKISNESPVGRALIGAKAGDIVEVNAPAGILKYQVVEIK